MWFSKKRTAPTVSALVAAPVATFTCEHVLVLHADGTNECDGHDTCGSDELAHEWSAPCSELGCACTGEEHDLVVAWPVAA